jgi:hypothetical protein
MPTVNLEYIEGTIKNPQHTKSTEACFIDTNLVHFPDGKLTPIPTFVQSAFIGGTIVGTVRSQWATILNTNNFEGAHYLFGSNYGLYAEYNQKRYNITPLKTVADATLSANPLSVVNASPIITVTYTSHGLAVGDRIRLAGATTTGGILAAEINKEHIVATVPTANTFTIVAGVNATSTATGGGSSINIFKQIAAGNEFQTLASGYGAGTYGVGLYGDSQTSATTFVFPRIWSFANFGNGVIMCPGDYSAGNGQKIYEWAGNNTVAPTVMANAPTDCQFVFVVNNRIIALCGNMIKIAGLDNLLAPVWNGFGYNKIPVLNSNRLLSGFKVGDKSAIIFAPEPMLLSFDGAVPDLVALGQEFSIAAPLAACALEDGLVWYGLDSNFYFYNGSRVQTIINHQNGEYIRQVINPAAIHTMFMMADPKHNQAWLYYPTGSSKNPDEYVIINPRRYSGAGKPSFTLGKQTRTSAQRPVAVLNRFYMFDTATQYTAFTNQPRSFAWSAKTAFFYVDGQQRARLKDIQPDFFQASQPVNLTVTGLEGAQGVETVYGTYEVAANAVRVTTPAAGQLLSFTFSGIGDMMIGTMRMNLELRGGRNK